MCFQGGIAMVPFYELQQEDIKIIHNKRELRYNTHVHEHLEIIYVFDIGQHINIDGTDYEIKAGQAAIIFPNIVHTYYRNEFRNTDEICIICSPNIFKGIFPNFTDYQPENPIIADIDDTVQLAFKELLTCTEFAEQVAWTMIILSRITKKITLKHKPSAPVAHLTSKIVNYVAENFREDITLDTLAKEFSVSKFYISHTFSDKLKTSLPGYLAFVRAKYAAEQLRSTSESITNIALDAGFSSQSTFNRVFLKIYGMTPREYKKNIDNTEKNELHAN